MANTTDIINQAMERTVGMSMQGEQLATQTALAKAEVARAGKEMQMRSEQFQIQQERIAMTNLMQGLLQLKGLETEERIARLNAMGRGTKQIDIMKFIELLTETPDLLNHLKEGEDIKSQIYETAKNPLASELYGAQIANVLNRLTNDPLTPETVMQHEGMLRMLDNAVIGKPETGKIDTPIIRRMFESLQRGREWVISEGRDISAFVQIKPYAYGGDKEVYNRGKELLNEIMGGESASRILSSVGLEPSRLWRHAQYIQDEAIRLDRSRGHPDALRDSQNFIKDFAKEIAKRTGYSKAIDNLDTWARTVASAWVGATTNKNTPEVAQFQKLLQSVGISMQDVPVIIPQEKQLVPFVDNYRSVMYEMKSKVAAKNQRDVMLLTMFANQSNPGLKEFLGDIAGKQQLRAEEQNNYNPLFVQPEKSQEQTHIKLTEQIMDELSIFIPTVQQRIDDIDGDEIDRALKRRIAQDIAWVGTYNAHKDETKAKAQAIKLLDYLDNLPKVGYDMYREGAITNSEVFNIYQIMTHPEEGYGLSFDASVEQGWEFLKAVSEMYGG